MSAWDRNIITIADASRHNRDLARLLLPESQRMRPRMGADAVNIVPENAMQRPDEWQQRLIKYIPSEALSFYIALDGLAHSMDKNYELIWLGSALLFALVFNILFLKLKWKVKRVSQITISTFALVAYVFALGGVFEQFRAPVMGTAVMIITTAFLSFFVPPNETVETVKVAAG